MAEYLQAPPRRKALGLLADALTSGKEALNTVNVPYLGGLGGLLLQQAPEYLQDVSYGMPAFTGGNVATGGLGTLTPDTRMLDVATLPFVGAGAAKAGQLGAKTLGKEVARQVETGTGLLGSNVLDPRQYATAYHGSPYLFDKFDIDKVGTGQGAQAYGQGMYFAENPAVAERFTESTAKISPRLRMAYDEAGGDWVKAEQIAQEKAKKDLTWQNIPLEAKSLPKGNLYKVDIPDKDIPKMLQWDKPFDKQTSDIKNIVKNIWKENNIPGDPTKLTGEGIYRSVVSLTSAKRMAAGESTSMDLSNYGIKGIKYLDAKSREAGKGTSNYVVFDPSNVEILERNNMGLLK